MPCGRAVCIAAACLLVLLIVAARRRPDRAGFIASGESKIDGLPDPGTCTTSPNPAAPNPAGCFRRPPATSGVPYRMGAIPRRACFGRKPPTSGVPYRAGYIPRAPYLRDLTADPVDAWQVGGNRMALERAALRPGGLPPPDPQRKSVYASTSAFYSTADVDPLITGQGYEYRDNTRDVYTERTALGSGWGLQEFADDSSPGAVGVDIGPNALAEYEGSTLGYNDGIPGSWAFPSTPIRWYRPRRADYYGRDGPAIAMPDQLYPTFVPDHEPQIGADPIPAPAGFLSPDSLAPPRSSPR